MPSLFLFFRKIKEFYSAHSRAIERGIIVLLLLIIIVPFGFNYLFLLAPSRMPSTSKSPSSGGIPSALPAPSSYGPLSLVKTPQRGAFEFTDQVNAQEGELTQRKIIKNGNLSLIVEDVRRTADSIKRLANQFGGFIQTSDINERTKDTVEGLIVIRVPAENFEEVFDKIKKLAVEVTRENVEARDVTEQFVDLEAQLRNLRAEENQYLEIMKRAYGVQDVLNVADYLSRVRGRIERIEGQLKYLSRQVDMSRITIELTAEAEVEIFGVRWKPIRVVKEAANDFLKGLVKFLDSAIKFIFRLPIYILWISGFALIVWIAFRIIRWIWHILKPKDKQRP